MGRVSPDFSAHTMSQSQTQGREESRAIVPLSPGRQNSQWLAPASQQTAPGDVHSIYAAKTQGPLYGVQLCDLCLEGPDPAVSQVKSADHSREG